MNASTIALVLLAVAAAGTISSALAASLAESSPRASAAFRVVAALLVDVRAALLAAQPNAPVAARRRAAPTGLPLAVWALSTAIVAAPLAAILALGGLCSCSGAADAEAIAAAKLISPLACGALVPIAGADGAFVGEACELVASFVEDEIQASETDGGAPALATASVPLARTLIKRRGRCASLSPVAGWGDALRVCHGLEAAALRGVQRARLARAAKDGGQ